MCLGTHVYVRATIVVFAYNGFFLYTILVAKGLIKGLPELRKPFKIRARKRRFQQVNLKKGKPLDITNKTKWLIIERFYYTPMN